MAAPRSGLTLLALGAVAALLAGGCRDEGSGSAAPTTAATSPAPGGDGGSTSAPEDPGAAELVLRGDGLGVIDLGAPPDDAVSAVAAVLGPPTVDTGWQPSFGAYGTCPGEHVRAAEWGHLVLLFTDGTTDHGAGRHLFAWRVTGAPPAVGTENGFGYGATAADAEELYPGRVERFPAEDTFPAVVEVEADGGRITAFLDEQDRVTNLEAGTPCGE